VSPPEVPAPPPDQILRDAIQFHRQVLQNVREGIVVFDRSQRYVVFNAYMEELTGLSATQVVGAHPAELFPTFAGGTAEAALHRALAGERVQRADVEQVNARGAVRWISDEWAPIRAVDGAVAGVVVAVRDITQRKQQEADVQQAHDRTSKALTLMGIAMWEMDLITGTTLWSENLGSLLDRHTATTGDLADSAGWLPLIHKDDRPRVDAAVTGAIKARTAFDVEFRVVLPGNKVRWLRSVTRISPSPDGQPTRLLGVTSDITEQRGLEARLRQSQKMEAIGQLAGGVAHDFNNLLTAISGYARFLEETVTQPNQQFEVSEIIKAADRAAALTRQLLAFSRQQVLERGVINPNELVANLTQMLERIIGEEVQLLTSLADDAGQVRADRSQIEQVVMNLVVNARDAMPSGGRIRIETSRVQVPKGDHQVGAGEPVPPGDWLLLTVSDTGIGMSEEIKARMFEPFFTTKESGRGTGLGLATAYGIVAQSGGQIRVYSEPGEGTTFRVYLPRLTDHAGAAPAPPAPRSSSQGGTETVLLVEDEVGVRFLASRILARAGYQVLEASGPDEA